MRYLTVHEAASLLRVSELTVRRWIWAGKLPAARLGRRVRIRPSDLHSLLLPSPRRDGSPDAAPRPGSPAALLHAVREIARVVQLKDVEELERLIAEGCERPGEVGSTVN
jgi:excisionase family DNA binding protein